MLLDSPQPGLPHVSGLRRGLRSQGQPQRGHGCHGEHQRPLICQEQVGGPRLSSALRHRQHHGHFPSTPGGKYNRVFMSVGVDVDVVTSSSLCRFLFLFLFLRFLSTPGTPRPRAGSWGPSSSGTCAPRSPAVTWRVITVALCFWVWEFWAQPPSPSSPLSLPSWAPPGSLLCEPWRGLAR